jgi:hypothetical protein
MQVNWDYRLQSHPLRVHRLLFGNNSVSYEIGEYVSKGRKMWCCPTTSPIRKRFHNYRQQGKFSLSMIPTSKANRSVTFKFNRETVNIVSRYIPNKQLVQRIDDISQTCFSPAFPAVCPWQSLRRREVGNIDKVRKIQKPWHLRSSCLDSGAPTATKISRTTSFSPSKTLQSPHSSLYQNTFEWFPCCWLEL